MAGWILLGIVVLAFLAGVVLHRRIAELGRRVERAWAQVEVWLHRRHEAITMLVEALEASATHERDALEALSQARASAMAAGGVAEQAEAEGAVTSALTSLLAVSGARPELRANQTFLDLEEELRSTEGRITYARRFYNDTVLRYNNTIMSFPAMAVARPLSYPRRELFEAGVPSRDPVPADL